MIECVEDSTYVLRTLVADANRGLLGGPPDTCLQFTVTPYEAYGIPRINYRLELDYAAKFGPRKDFILAAGVGNAVQSEATALAASAHHIVSLNLDKGFRALADKSQFRYQAQLYETDDKVQGPVFLHNVSRVAYIFESSAVCTAFAQWLMPEAESKKIEIALGSYVVFEDSTSKLEEMKQMVGDILDDVKRLNVRHLWYCGGDALLDHVVCQASKRDLKGAHFNIRTHVAIVSLRAPTSKTGCTFQELNEAFGEGGSMRVNPVDETTGFNAGGGRHPMDKQSYPAGGTAVNAMGEAWRPSDGYRVDANTTCFDDDNHPELNAIYSFENNIRNLVGKVSRTCEAMADFGFCEEDGLVGYNWQVMSRACPISCCAINKYSPGCRTACACDGSRGYEMFEASVISNFGGSICGPTFHQNSSLALRDAAGFGLTSMFRRIHPDNVRQLASLAPSVAMMKDDVFWYSRGYQPGARLKPCEGKAMSTTVQDYPCWMTVYMPEALQAELSDGTLAAWKALGVLAAAEPNMWSIVESNSEQSKLWLEENLFAAFCQVEFEGATGHVAFDQTGNRLSGSMISRVESLWWSMMGTGMNVVPSGAIIGGKLYWVYEEFHRNSSSCVEHSQRMTWIPEACSDYWYTQPTNTVVNRPLMQPSDCPQGEYPFAVLEGETLRDNDHCVSCQPGTHKRSKGPQRCERCPEGRSANGTGHVECDACARGRFTVFSRVEQVGLFGELQEYGESGSCEACPTGTYSSKEGQRQCTVCPPGQFTASVGSTECELCPRGFYSSTPSATACIACGQGYTTMDKGSQKLDACVCPVGERRMDNGLCKVCDEYLRCPNSTTVLLEPGYYMPDDSSRTVERLNVYKCMSKEFCPGQTTSADPVCGQGSHRTGINCGLCEDGYYMSEDVCEECGEGGSNALFLLGCGIGFVVCFIVHMAWNSSKSAHVEATEGVLASVTFGLTLGFMQSLGVFSHLGFEWPNEFKDILQFVDIFLFDLSILKPACMIPQSLASAYVTKLSVPIYFSLMFFTFNPLSVLLNKLTGGRTAIASWEGIWNSLGMVIQALYISVASSTLSLVECYPSPNGQQTVRGYPYAECDSNEFYAMIPVFVLGVLLYIVGIFSLFCYLAYAAPNQYDDIKFRTKVRFLVFKFRANMWWYGLTLMTRSFLLAMVAVVFPDHAFNQFIAMNCILVTGTVVHLLLSPYSDRFANILELIELAVLLAIMSFGSYFITGSNIETGDSRTYSLILVGLTVFMFTTVFVVFCWAMYLAQYPQKALAMHSKQVDDVLPRLRAISAIIMGADDETLKGVIQNASYIDRHDVYNMVAFFGLELTGMNVAQRWEEKRLSPNSSGARLERSKSKEALSKFAEEATVSVLKRANSRIQDADGLSRQASPEDMPLSKSLEEDTTI